MELQKITNTCSMFELGQFNTYLIKSTKFSKDDFLKFIQKQFVKLGIHESRKNYSILYNCTSRSNYKFLKKLGFRQVSSYRGYAYNNVKILIWKSAPYSLIEKIEMFFNL